MGTDYEIGWDCVEDVKYCDATLFIFRSQSPKLQESKTMAMIVGADLRVCPTIRNKKGGFETRRYKWDGVLKQVEKPP